MECLICGKHLASYKAYPGHLTTKHKMTTQEYYDKFFKKSNEGICIVCGKPTRFVNLSTGYKQYCCLKCAEPYIQEKQKQTILEKYGVSNFGITTEAIKKKTKTMNDKYGVDYFCTTKKCLDAGHTKEALEKQKKTYLQKYGVDTPFKTEKCKKAGHTKEANEKRIKTNLSKYNKKYPFSNSNSDIAKLNRKKTMIEKYGVDHNFKRDDVRQLIMSDKIMKKKHDTKKANGWCRSSNEELLKQFFDSNNITYKRNYKSLEYPHKVDFYIKGLNLYIEINTYWMHGFHWFDSNNQDDVNIVNKWNNSDSEQYKYAAKVWTAYDTKKKEHAIENKLNYVVIWTKDQLNQFIIDFKEKEFTGFVDYNDRKA